MLIEVRVRYAGRNDDSERRHSGKLGKSASHLGAVAPAYLPCLLTRQFPRLTSVEATHRASCLQVYNKRGEHVMRKGSHYPEISRIYRGYIHQGRARKHPARDPRKPNGYLKCEPNSNACEVKITLSW